MPPSTLHFARLPSRSAHCPLAYCSLFGCIYGLGCIPQAGFSDPANARPAAAREHLLAARGCFRTACIGSALMALQPHPAVQCLWLVLSKPTWHRLRLPPSSLDPLSPYSNRPDLGTHSSAASQCPLRLCTVKIASDYHLGSLPLPHSISPPPRQSFQNSTPSLSFSLRTARPSAHPS